MILQIEEWLLFGNQSLIFFLNYNRESTFLKSGRKVFQILVCKSFYSSLKSHWYLWKKNLKVSIGIRNTQITLKHLVVYSQDNNFQWKFLNLLQTVVISASWKKQSWKSRFTYHTTNLIKLSAFSLVIYLGISLSHKYFYHYVY